MRMILNFHELKANLKTIDEYLILRKDPEYTFALNLIKRGTCFVVIKENDSYKFYPSRFIGYHNNSMDAHLDSIGKDGRITNSVISEIFGRKPLPDP